MLKFSELKLPGLFTIDNFVAKDERGIFVKTGHENKFEEMGFTGKFRESYYSLSYKNVIRGMHFQTPPNDHEKLVYVTSGKILDVILDLRKSSETFGQYATIELLEFGNSVFIPRGCAHGFLTLSDTATVVYNVATVYNSEADSGILWNSFGFDWPVLQPIISDRDQNFLSLDTYNSPF